LKEEALDRTVWRTRFGRGYGPVVRQTTEWMNSARGQWCSVYFWGHSFSTFAAKCLHICNFRGDTIRSWLFTDLHFLLPFRKPQILTVQRQSILCDVLWSIHHLLYFSCEKIHWNMPRPSFFFILISPSVTFTVLYYKTYVIKWALLNKQREKQIA
jgi:hypothetical protein